MRPDLLAALPCFCGCVPYAPADQGLAVAEVRRNIVAAFQDRGPSTTEMVM